MRSTLARVVDLGVLALGENGKGEGGREKGENKNRRLPMIFFQASDLTSSPAPEFLLVRVSLCPSRKITELGGKVSWTV